MRTDACYDFATRSLEVWLSPDWDSEDPDTRLVVEPVEFVVKEIGATDPIPPTFRIHTEEGILQFVAAILSAVDPATRKDYMDELNETFGRTLGRPPIGKVRSD